MCVCASIRELGLCSTPLRLCAALTTATTKGPSLISTTTTARYALVDGCAKNDARHLMTEYGSPRSIIDTSAAVGKVQCCAMDGSSCTRKDENGVCLGGTSMLSFVSATVAEAKCSDMGMRLCQSQAEVDQCCGAGCGYDDNLVKIEGVV